MADKDERKITGGNRRLAKKRVQCLNEALSFVSSSVLADSLVLRKPLLRQAPKRYVPYYDDNEMTELIPTINDIVKYGLNPNWTETDNDKLLERNLVKIYDLYFDIEYNFDEKDFPDCEKTEYSKIRQNVTSNFKDFGLYKTILNINDIDNLSENEIGDALDDLTDIIIDLLEIKRRIENNSLADGLWFFELIFQSHTQEHILNLLNFMKQKNG